MSIKSIGRYIRHDIVAQKDFVASYLLAFGILALALLINKNHNDHKYDGQYWISPLESALETSFRNVDMTEIIMTFGILIAFFVFVISVVIKRTSLDNIRLANQRRVQDARDDLLALASHQLRTPATGVKQYLGIVRENMAGDITPKQRKLIDRAYYYNETQLRIINDFLYMAKLDADRIIVHNSDFDLVELTEEIVHSYKYRIDAKDLTVQINAPLTLAINSDKQCIRMSIENLLSNAIKYTNTKGSIKIEINKNDVTAIFNITDNGVGIRKRDSSKLFKKFSRIDNPLSSLEGGSGIGLYIAKKLIELNHGEISHKHLVNGSRFTIELPL